MNTKHNSDFASFFYDQAPCSDVRGSRWARAEHQQTEARELDSL
jgi:hypothetical protein